MIFLISTDTCYGIGCPISDIKDYISIYEIKKRDFSKPLAIMVESFDWLKEHTNLNLEQINFLKNYNKPFSVLADCDKIKMYLEFAGEYENFPNFDQYKKFSFRVAHNEEQKKLIKELGPVFLTSANFSGEDEIYEIEKLKGAFASFMKSIKILSNKNLDKNIKPSDIFEFLEDSLEVRYLRRS